MFSIRSFARPVAVALALALSAAPIAAQAEGRQASAEVKKQKSFPMKAESFNTMIEKRITKSREHLTKALTKRNVPAAKQTEIKKEFEAGVVALRALSQQVQADGTVTKEEAKQVRTKVKSLKGNMRGHRKPGKNKTDKVAA